jgi:hypothetical protein
LSDLSFDPCVSVPLRATHHVNVVMTARDVPIIRDAHDVSEVAPLHCGMDSGVRESKCLTPRSGTPVVRRMTYDSFGADDRGRLPRGATTTLCVCMRGRSHSKGDESYL